MNYGKHETECRLKSPHSKSSKYASQLSLNIFKALFVLYLFLAVVGVSIGSGMVKGIIDNIPFVDILNVQPDYFATTAYDVVGNLTDTPVTSDSNCGSATYDELPQNLINTFIVTKDLRLRSRNGTDIRSTTRAVRGVVSGDYVDGGSTTTQQLIKNNVFFGGMESGWDVKIERRLQGQYLVIQLEKNPGMSKEETKNLIITNCLNTINLGNNILNIKIATERYLNKNVSDLTLSGCTALVSITKNPPKLNPTFGRESNVGRRRIVLQHMYDQGFILREEQKEALADDVYDRIQNVDTATKENNTHYNYFTDELIGQVIFSPMGKLDYSKSQASNLPYSGGLQIYTAQDPSLRAAVDEEINNPDDCSIAKYSAEYRLSVTHADDNTQHYSEEDLKTFHKTELGNPSFDGSYKTEEIVQADINAFKAWLLKDGDEITGERQNLILQSQTSFVLMDQHTGKIKALYGGHGEEKASLILNRISNVYHQSGPAFKVISVFVPAMDAYGATLGTVCYGAPYTIGTRTFKDWQDKGYGFVGYHNIHDNIIHSMNIVAVRTLTETVTPQLDIEYAENMDISSLIRDDLGAVTALDGLTKGVSSLGLVAAYASIANTGVYTKPRFFTKILDHDGKALTDNESETKQVLKDSTAFLSTDAMPEFIKSNRLSARLGVSINSTSIGAALTSMSAAGKSGTTTANNDVWSVGYTPYYTIGIWGGYDSNQELSNGNGGTSFHKDIWRSIMNRVHNGMSGPGLTILDSIETAEICRKSEKRVVTGVCTADPGGNAVYTEYFAKGTAPTEVCDRHMTMIVCVESGMRLTPHCPTKIIRVCMTLPDGENDATGDSTFAIPGYCPIHTNVSTVINPSLNGSGGDGPVVIPIGPGYQPPTFPSSTIEGYGPDNTPY